MYESPITNLHLQSEYSFPGLMDSYTYNFADPSLVLYYASGSKVNVVVVVISVEYV